jgi:hypothetical protein
MAQELQISPCGRSVFFSLGLLDFAIVAPIGKRAVWIKGLFLSKENSGSNRSDSDPLAL